MHIHCQPVVYTVRIYQDGKSYANHDDYLGVCTVQMLGDGTAWVSGLSGNAPQKYLAHTILSQMQAWAGARGITKLRWDSEGEVKECRCPVSKES